MRAFGAIVATTIRQLIGGKRVIALGLLALVPAIVAVAVTSSTGRVTAFRDFHDAPIAIVFIIVLPIVALILGASSLGDERQGQTLSFLVLRPMRRETVAAAKVAAGWVASWIVIATGAGLAAVAAGVASQRWEPLGAILVATAISTLGYVAVFTLLGYVTGRAVLLGLAYVFIWESGVTFAADSLANVSLFRIGLTAYAAMVPDAERYIAEPLAALQPGMWGALAKVLIIAGVAIAAIGVLLRRRDVV
jgi:ABC-type transport system involved in multi-copper enzyme maturation permease subunit